ncbi:hypothetical protein R6Q57_020566 [Mikania cordata]
MGLLSTLDPPTQYALMVNSFATPTASSQSDQVSVECSSVCSSCFTCVDLRSKVLSYQIHNSAFISDLNQCLEANKVLKANEKDFQSKIDLLNRQLHVAEIAVLNKQDAITSFLNTINELKKKLATVECDYETLGQKLKSYESSSYIIEHMINKGDDHKDKGKGTINYQRCPPPILNSFVNTPNDKDVNDFQVKTPLVIDPIGMVTDEGSSLSTDYFVDGLVEDWVSNSEDESDDSSECVITQNPLPVIKKSDPISSSKIYQALGFVKASKENEACVLNKMTSYKSVTKHNICAHLDLTTPNAKNYTEIITFLRRSRIFAAISTIHIPYRSHQQDFWESASIDCEVEPPVIRGKVLGHDVVVSAEHLRRLCGFQDTADQPYFARSLLGPWLFYEVQI